jgi:hypothetical protein
MSYTTNELSQIERLIRISREKPINHETFVPWDVQLDDAYGYLPDNLVSLYQHPVFDTMTVHQQRELARREVVQAMYSYCWSEGLFCAFMTRYIMHLPPEHPERRYLLHEIIEESKHQQMFALTIQKMESNPVPVTKMQGWMAEYFVRYSSPSLVSCIAIELMADRYGDRLRHEDKVHPILQKVSQLHNIEEARHILFTKMLLQRYTKNCSFLKSTMYSIIVLLNMRFFQSTYVKAEIYRDLGLPNPNRLSREAFRSYQLRFAEECLDSVKELVEGFNGFNFITRPLWRWVLRMPV